MLYLNYIVAACFLSRRNNWTYSLGTWRRKCKDQLLLLVFKTYHFNLQMTQSLNGSLLSHLRCCLAQKCQVQGNHLHRWSQGSCTSENINAQSEGGKLELTLKNWQLFGNVAISTQKDYICMYGTVQSILTQVLVSKHTYSAYYLEMCVPLSSMGFIPFSLPHMHMTAAVECHGLCHSWKAELCIK